IQHNQNNSGLLCRSRRPEGAPSPIASDTSDSDISLGTHSPVPSSIQLQHSPGSTSNGANDREESLSIDGDKPRDLATSLSASNLVAASSYATTAPLSTCLPAFKLDTATSLFNAGCYLQSFSNLKEMSQQFPIQPIVIRPQPHLPAQAHGLNGSHLHAAVNYPPPPAYAVDCTPPKIRVNSPEKLNSTANSIAATLSTVAALQDTSVYQHHHHSAQMLHRPFSTSPEIPHNNHNAAPSEIT
ncbi:PREDICTED: protein Optix-like, partial [Rhagoletis zephyria]